MKRLLKKLASRLPRRWQQELKRVYFARHISTGRFRTPEQEYEILPGLVSEGDWVLDVGANIGHYSARLGKLVGPRGRVIAFEPVPQTFELLTANMALLPVRNITLINAAASDTTGVVGMEIPTCLDSIIFPEPAPAPAIAFSGPGASPLRCVTGPCTSRVAAPTACPPRPEIAARGYATGRPCPAPRS